MFKHYLIIALRNLVKNKINSAIKIIGLALGFSAGLIVLIVNYSELTWDSFWVDSDKIYKFEFYNGNIATSSFTSARLASVIHKVAPDIEAVGRLERSMIMVSFPDPKTAQMQLFHQSVTRIDDSILDIFSLSESAGSLADFRNNPTAAIINKTIAKRYFGNSNPIGKHFTISASQLQGPSVDATDKKDDEQRIYKVVAVIEDVNRRSNEVYQVVIPLQEKESHKNSWFDRTLSTYIKLNNVSNLPVVQDSINRYVKEYLSNENAFSDIDLNFRAINIVDLHLDGADQKGGRKQIFLLYLLGFLVLTITLINHINLTLSSFLQRKKEIALRRLSGASYWQLFIQFWIDAFCYLLLSILFALMVVEPIVPYIASILNLRLEDKLLQANGLLVSVLLLFLASSLLIATYTVLRVAGGSLTSVLQANRSRETLGDIRLRKVFYTLQVVGGSALLICVVIASLQVNRMTTFDPGYNTKNVFFFHGQQFLSANKGQFSELKSKIESNPAVKNITRARPSLLGAFSQPSYISRADLTKTDAVTIALEHIPDFAVLDTFEVDLLAGSLPDHGDEFLNSLNVTSTSKAKSLPPNELVICEETRALLGYTNAQEAIGQSIKMYMGEHGIPMKIVAVTEPFHFGDINQPPKPCAFWQVTFGNAINWSINYDGDNYKEVQTLINKIWGEVMGGVPSVYPLQGVIDASANREKVLVSFLYVLAAVSIIISLLGLYGFARLNIQKRQLEIALRKLHGASPLQIISLLTKDFTLLVILGNFIAWPIAIYGLSKWLENFYQPVDLIFWAPVACAIALCTSLLLTNATVFLQSILIARKRPTDALYYE